MPLVVQRSSSSGPPDTANGQYVSGNFFQTLGVSAWRGRLFVDADDLEGAPPVAVMSFHAWQEKYGSDPSVVGSTYQINRQAFTIIGVAPADFVGAKMTSWGLPDIWMPLQLSSKDPGYDGDNYEMIARLAAGVSLAQIQQQLRNALQNQRLPPDLAATYIPQLVDQAIAERAVSYEAEQLGVRISDRDLAYNLRSLPFGSMPPDQYQQYVEQQTGMSVPEFENNLRLKGYEDSIINLATATADIVGSFLFQHLFGHTLAPLILVSAAFTALAFVLLPLLHLGNKPQGAAIGVTSAGAP